MTTAYDYDNQVWVSGPAAVALRLRQLDEEIDLLVVDPLYARMLGIPTYEATQIALAAMRLERAYLQAAR